MYNKTTSIVKNNLFRTENMCTFIKMEYLVANAIVELYERKGVDSVSLEKIKEYGIKVEEKMNVDENTNAILLYSNNYMKEFLQDYSDWFEMIGDYIKMKDGVSIDDIREHILSSISIDMLIVLFDQSLLDVVCA